MDNNQIKFSAILDHIQKYLLNDDYNKTGNQETVLSPPVFVCLPERERGDSVVIVGWFSLLL